MPLCGDNRIRHNEQGNVLFTDGAIKPWTELDYRHAGLERIAWLEEDEPW
jgi:prepilin-type processing-associated H-X9-DG protein